MSEPSTPLVVFYGERNREDLVAHRRVSTLQNSLLPEGWGLRLTPWGKAARGLTRSHFQGSPAVTRPAGKDHSQTGGGIEHQCISSPHPGLACPLLGLATLSPGPEPAQLLPEVTGNLSKLTQFLVVPVFLPPMAEGVTWATFGAGGAGERPQRLGGTCCCVRKGKCLYRS